MMIRVREGVNGSRYLAVFEREINTIYETFFSVRQNNETWGFT
jgi:hypothetical protein